MQTIGQYQVEAELLRTSAILVYQARDSLGMRVLLKLLLLPGAEEREHFERQAASLSRLRHPNLVRVQSVGIHDDQPFMVLDLVTGGTLADRLRDEGALGVDQAVETMRVIARALHHAHEQSIVHGDLTPACVLLPPGRGPKLADFGLARYEGGTWNGEGGRFPGTPGFMPPELLFDQPEPPTVLSDVYSLGATLYAALSGQPPFGGDTPAEVRQATLEGAARPLFGTVPGLNPGLDAICLRCLDKNPELRYQSARDLADALERYLAGDLVKPAWTEGATLEDEPGPAHLRDETLPLSPNDSRMLGTDFTRRVAEQRRADHQTVNLSPQESPLVQSKLAAEPRRPDHQTVNLSRQESPLVQSKFGRRSPAQRAPDHQTLELPPSELPPSGGLQGAVTLPLPDAPLPIPAPPGAPPAAPSAPPAAPGGVDTMEMPEPRPIADPPSGEVDTFELPPWKRRHLGIPSEDQPQSDTRKDPSTGKGQLSSTATSSRPRARARGRPATVEPGPGLLITLACGGVLLTVLAVLLGWQLIGLKRQLRKAAAELRVETAKLDDLEGEGAGLRQTLETLREELASVKAVAAKVQREVGALQGKRAEKRREKAERWLRRGHALRGAVLAEGSSALDAYSKAIEADPRNAEAHFWRGELHYAGNKKTLAVGDYTRAIQLDDKLAMAYLGRARVRYDQRMRRGALEDLERALQMDDTLIEAYYLRGMVKNRMGDVQGARADYTRVIKAQPDHVSALMNRGNMLNRLGDYKGALRDYSAAIAADPENIHPYRIRGTQRLEMGDSQGAMLDAIAIVKRNPVDPHGWALMGRARYVLEDLEGSLEAWGFVTEFARPGSGLAREAKKSIATIKSRLAKEGN